MQEAQRQGFLEVAGQLTSAENVETLKNLSDDEILHFVQAVSWPMKKPAAQNIKPF